MARYADVQAAFEEGRSELVDDAESQLVAMVQAGEWPAVRYTLSTLGKDRGYTTRPDPEPPKTPEPPPPDPFEEGIAIIREVYGEEGLSADIPRTD
jgi:hypothetical protein